MLKGGYGGGKLARVTSEFLAAVREEVRGRVAKGTLPAGMSISLDMPNVIRLIAEGIRRSWTPSLNAKVRTQDVPGTVVWLSVPFVFHLATQKHVDRACERSHRVRTS